MTIPIADLIPDPTISWDWVRLANMFLSAILIGEVGNVLWHYRGQRGGRSTHVRLVGVSCASYAFAIAYGSIRLLGSPPSPVTATIQLVSVLGGLAGILGVYLILRHSSGKSDRGGS